VGLARCILGSESMDDSFWVWSMSITFADGSYKFARTKSHYKSRLFPVTYLDHPMGCPAAH
jgi:hypothetical protein